MNDIEHKSSEPKAEHADETVDPNRRQALLRMSGYAAAVAPAMLVLMNGKADAKPACDVPAWELGLKKNGHSGC